MEAHAILGNAGALRDVGRGMGASVVADAEEHIVARGPKQFADDEQSRSGMGERASCHQAKMVGQCQFAFQMIAVFYHTILSGGTIPINMEFACQIMQEQMRALTKSGLLDVADEFHVGINGDADDLQVAKLFVPCPNAKFVMHGSGMTSEIPTMAYLRRWLPGHDDWKVLYFHIKGVTHPVEPLYAVWRERMMKAVVWGWRDCVAQLDIGTDACGCHWLTPEQFPNLVKMTPFFGGTFWWATAKFLMTLPPLPQATWANRFAAENWIGIGPRRPRVKDYYPGWP